MLTIGINRVAHLNNIRQLPRHFSAETKRFGLGAGFRPPFSGCILVYRCTNSHDIVLLVCCCRTKVLQLPKTIFLSSLCNTAWENVLDELSLWDVLLHLPGPWELVMRHRGWRLRWPTQRTLGAPLASWRSGLSALSGLIGRAHDSNILGVQHAAVFFHGNFRFTVVI